MTLWPSVLEANEMLNEWCSNINLKRHALAVAAAMKAYANKFSQNPERWVVVGLLHDLDYEKYSTPETHPFKGCEYLGQKGYSQELIDAILAHAEYSGVHRDTPLKKAIFAVDELTGLIVAVALTRPSKKVADVTVESVLKKWNQKAFAAGVNRALIEKGATELGVPLREHIQIVLEAMQSVAGEIGL